jgi:hypothetical protein
VQEGHVYIVSDYIDGPDLRRWLRDHSPAWPEAARVAAAVTPYLDATSGTTRVWRARDRPLGREAVNKGFLSELVGKAHRGGFDTKPG